ncbi:MAG TPA: hypothetical protein VHM89_16335 [Acidimicrobiales bacterium]|nr:hypothetical protein [Acidimicrobiales bacterium]
MTPRARITGLVATAAMLVAAPAAHAVLGGLPGLDSPHVPVVKASVATDGTIAASVDGTGIEVPVPAVPAIPAVPGLDALPAVPGMPAVPGVPTLPAVPGVPTLPGLPALPGVPALPGLPDLSSLPLGGSLPSVPGLPAVPAVPSTEAVAGIVSTVTQLVPAVPGLGLVQGGATATAGVNAG